MLQLRLTLLCINPQCIRQFKSLQYQPFLTYVTEMCFLAVFFTNNNKYKVTRPARPWRTPTIINEANIIKIVVLTHTNLIIN
jgi:hypothetical protein